MSIFLNKSPNLFAQTAKPALSKPDSSTPLYPPSDDEDNLSDNEEAMSTYESILKKAADRYTPTTSQSKISYWKRTVTGSSSSDQSEKNILQNMDRLIPSIPQDLNPQMLAKLEPGNRNSEISESDKQGEGRVEHILKDKEIIGQKQKAAVQTVQLGIKTTTLVGVFGGAAAIAYFLPAVTFMSLLVPAALIVNLVSTIGDLTAELVTNKQAFPDTKRKAVGILKKLFEPDKQDAIHFAGKKQQKKQQQNPFSIHQLKEQLYALVVESEKKIQGAENAKQLSETLQGFLKTFIALNFQAVEQSGSDEEKRKAKIIQGLSEDYRDYINSVPPEAKTMREVPIMAQNKLRKMIYISLSSKIEDLIDWGSIQARQIGMTESQINKVIHLSQLDNT
jgi:hypothetical protein